MNDRRADMLIDFREYPKDERWDRCLEALRSEYTVTIRSMCEDLKCARTWVARYVLPRLHYIYISNGAGGRANYLAISNASLERRSTETTYYSETEFRELIIGNLCEATRQTICVPIETFVREDVMEDFCARHVPLEKISAEFLRTGDGKKRAEMMRDREKLLRECFTERGMKTCEAMAASHKRSKTPVVPVAAKVTSASELIAVHDLKGYGGTDEEVYRMLFSEGCIRLVLRLDDEFGKTSEKVYYYRPDDGFKGQETLELLTVGYEAFARNYPELL